jgi:hypothetical protein
MVSHSSIKIFISALTLVFVLIFPIVYSARNASDYAKGGKNTSLSSEFGFWDINFTKYIKTEGAAQMKFTVSGKSMRPKGKQLGIFHTAMPDALIIREAKLTFYENNRPVSILTAEEAISTIPLNADPMNSGLKGNIIFSKNAGLVLENKSALFSDQIEWRPESGEIIARGASRIRTEGEFVAADEIKTDIKLTKFETKENKDKRLRKIFAFLTEEKK